MPLNRKGFTLAEALITAALTAILAVGVAKIFSYTIQFFHSARVRQDLQSDSDRCLSLMTPILQSAQPQTVAICSCEAAACTATCGNAVPAGTPPNSRIEFKPEGSATVTSIYQNADSVLLQVGANPPQVLVQHHVVGLSFSGDASDLTRVYISLLLAAPSSPRQMAQAAVANQPIRLGHATF